MGKKKGGDKGNDKVAAPSKQSKKEAKKFKAAQATKISKAKHFEEKAKKKEKLDKLRVQSHPKKRYHKPVSGSQAEPVDIHHASDDGMSDSSDASNESTYISIKDASAAKSANTAATAITIKDDDDEVPWMAPGQRYRDRNVFLCLHEEILDFARFLSPTAAEKTAREELVARMQDIVSSLWQGATLDTFGSQLTEMFLPSSDIDMVVLDGPSGKGPLHQLGRHLQEMNMVSFLEVVDSARIPIVKFVDTQSGLHVDISFGVTSGFATADLVMLYQRKYPPFRPLTLLLKYFLQQRGLNETFKGGVGSFLLQLMVVSFLQHTNRNSGHVPRAPQDLGHLLVHFLDLYGNVFNAADLSISVRNGGTYFKKTDNDWKNYSRPELLSMENPHDPNHDVGANSYEVRRVFKVFSHAAKVLKAEIMDRGTMSPHHDQYGTSILERIIAIDPLLASRDGPTKFGFTILKNDAAKVKEIEARYAARES
ncbi:Aste57867_25125 [Aphanomyces stellatus]|uniref:polynucleotide adenylyltransferase n=1 Tax=Aphanomyces stellatus TaxID=120398 RepID=A0A485LSB4_9STRA|nr:hypothetical protein As57867_025047 [Aphanomyces stellatus]VFU01756.1 Aste57867_25125 [Aphanomyces stellatus]